MFTTTYTIQAPSGFMFFDISVSCKKLNNNDEMIDFSLVEHVHVWFSSEESKDYKSSPNAMVLGLWLSLTERIKSDKSNISRDVVVNNVSIKAEGALISFGLDTSK